MLHLCKYHSVLGPWWVLIDDIAFTLDKYSSIIRNIIKISMFQLSAMVSRSYYKFSKIKHF